MASTYCKVDFNWKSDAGDNVTFAKATNVIRYSFVDVDYDSSEFENISYENRVNSHDNILLRFLKEDNDENFTVTIICNNPEFSQIDGISVDSESRTLEMSNDREGYIKTVRGRKLVTESESTEDSDFFVCSCSFGKPYSSLSIKFLSLGSKESVCIRTISINLRQHNLNYAASKANTFDMVKLKKDIEEMGDAVSDKALDFLATMETFEKNKMSSLGGLFIQDTLMSTETQNGMSSPGISSIMRSVLGDKAMRDLEESVPESGDESISEHSSIYNMLQAMCGKVTQSRKPPPVIKEVSSMDTDENQEQPKTNGKEVEGVNGILLQVLNQKVEEAKQDMREEIHRVKDEVIGHMEDMKREITGQLNNICVLLQGLQANSQNSYCVEDE